MKFITKVKGDENPYRAAAQFAIAALAACLLSGDDGPKEFARPVL